MTKFKIDKGIEGNLPTSGMAEEGHMYVTSDKGNAYFAPSDDGNLVPINRSPYYLTCPTAAGTATKSATMPDGEPLPNTLRAGIFVVVKFAASNTATSPSLKITDGFGRVYGPIAIKEYGTTAVGASASLSWRAGEAVAFLYDGTNWLRVSHIIDIVQSDWEQSTDNSADFIKNKPAIVKGTGSKSIQEGNNTSATGSYSHAQNNGTKAIGANSHAEGAKTVAVGLYSHAEGTGTATAISGVSGGTGSSTTIYSTTADHGLSVGDVVEYDGNYTTVSNIVNPRLFMVSETLGELSSATINLVKGVAYKRGSHVEGRECIATGEYAHAEGYDTEAGANYTHAEGYGTKASGLYAHSEGRDTKASGAWSHAEGRNTVAGGSYAHAEGRNTTAGNHSHSEGYYTEANCISYGAHAEGANTVTNNDCEHAEGRYNSSRKNSTTFGDAGNTLHSIGIGTSDSDRKNAVEVMQNGDVYVFGLGGYDGTTIQGKTTLKSLLEAAAIDATVVHKTGSETIGGDKTFTGITSMLDYLIIATTNQAKHSVYMSLRNYYDDGEDGMAVLEYGDDDGTGPVILRGVGDPVVSYDAATKGYVDDIVGDIETLLAAI